MAETEMEERLRDAETRARDAEAMMIQVQVMLRDEGGRTVCLFKIIMFFDQCHDENVNPAGCRVWQDSP